MSTPKYHYTAPYLLNPQHQITVNVIGCGGTGSHLLSGLALMNQALQAVGHLGLYVTAYDDKEVSEANMGRQTFFPADIGTYKAVTLISRINRSFGYNWRAIPEKYDQSYLRQKTGKLPFANITFSCVDTIHARREIRKTFSNQLRKAYGNIYREPHSKPLYWMDFGNLKSTGQAVLSTLSDIKQPEDGAPWLPNVFELFPQLKKMKDDPNIPSCSVHAALNSQDLFINSLLAQHGLDLVWKMFREAKVSHQGLFMNLVTQKTNPIYIS